MFTGIIEAKSKILSIDDGKFLIENTLQEKIKIWQSIAHDGACMTIDEIYDTSYSFFVMQESLNKTNFHEKKIGDYFNIERCLRAQDRIDGHFVSGHIDTTGILTDKKRIDDWSLILTVQFDSSFSQLTIEKWSIALNGVSLTIINKKTNAISVSLIPLTQDWTNLSTLKVGSSINIEFDMLGKYILGTQKNV